MASGDPNRVRTPPPNEVSVTSVTWARLVRSFSVNGRLQGPGAASAPGEAAGNREGVFIREGTLALEIRSVNDEIPLSPPMYEDPDAVLYRKPRTTDAMALSSFPVPAKG